MTMIGFERFDFKTNDGTLVTGCNIFISRDVDPNKGQGTYVERHYISDAKAKKNGIDLKALYNQPVRVYYNRFGKLDTVVLDK